MTNPPTETSTDLRTWADELNAAVNGGSLPDRLMSVGGNFLQKVGAGEDGRYPKDILVGAKEILIVGRVSNLPESGNTIGGILLTETVDQNYIVSDGANGWVVKRSEDGEVFRKATTTFDNSEEKPGTQLETDFPIAVFDIPTNGKNVNFRFGSRTEQESLEIANFINDGRTPKGNREAFFQRATTEPTLYDVKTDITLMAIYASNE